MAVAAVEVGVAGVALDGAAADPLGLVTAPALYMTIERRFGESSRNLRRNPGLVDGLRKMLTRGETGR
jgi:hypothetical protein